jgi:hypothetical protein
MDGTKPGVGISRCVWTPPVDVVMRERGTPEGASLRFDPVSAGCGASRGRKSAERTLKRVFGSWENEPGDQFVGGRWFGSAPVRGRKRLRVVAVALTR